MLLFESEGRVCLNRDEVRRLAELFCETDYSLAGELRAIVNPEDVSYEELLVPSQGIPRVYSLVLYRTIVALIVYRLCNELHLDDPFFPQDDQYAGTPLLTRTYVDGLRTDKELQGVLDLFHKHAAARLSMERILSSEGHRSRPHWCTILEGSLRLCPIKADLLRMIWSSNALGHRICCAHFLAGILYTKRENPGFRRFFVEGLYDPAEDAVPLLSELKTSMKSAVSAERARNLVYGLLEEEEVRKDRGLLLLLKSRLESPGFDFDAHYSSLIDRIQDAKLCRLPYCE